MILGCRPPGSPGLRQPVRQYPREDDRRPHPHLLRRAGAPSVKNSAETSTRSRPTLRSSSRSSTSSKATAANWSWSSHQRRRHLRRRYPPPPRGLEGEASPGQCGGPSQHPVPFLPANQFLAARSRTPRLRDQQITRLRGVQSRRGRKSSGSMESSLWPR